MKIQIIGVIPEIFTALNYGMPGRAQQKGKMTIDMLNLRDFSEDKHRRIDDRPYGGGPGMVLKAEPLSKAIKAALNNTPEGTLVSFLSPHGIRFDQRKAQQLSQRSHLILVAGRYEGMDERVYAAYPHEVFSLGDFVLSGGEAGILCMIDAISRLIPDVLGNAESIHHDSFDPRHALLDHPHYTRPLSFNGISVPSVLVSGNHKAIAEWRRQKAIEYTAKYRPDLLERYQLSLKGKAE